MKSNKKIMSLPIINVMNGNHIGKIRCLLVDPEVHAVVALVIEDKEWYRGVKVIPLESISAIGDDAIMIQSEDHILKARDVADYENLLENITEVVGTNVFSNTGSRIGKVSDFYIDDNGSIVKIEVALNDGSTNEYNVNDDTTLSKDIIVLP